MQHTPHCCSQSSNDECVPNIVPVVYTEASMQPILISPEDLYCGVLKNNYTKDREFDTTCSMWYNTLYLVKQGINIRHICINPNSN